MGNCHGRFNRSKSRDSRGSDIVNSPDSGVKEKKPSQLQRQASVDSWWTASQLDLALNSIIEATPIIPELSQLVVDYVVGPIRVGAKVDVQDYVGKWVPATIIEIDPLRYKERMAYRKPQSLVNCPDCNCYNTDITSFPYCYMCGIKLPPMHVPDLPPDVPDKSCRVSARVRFVGWTERWDEWVPLNRIAAYGEKLRQIWLYNDNTVCIRVGPWSQKDCDWASLLMGRIKRVRTNAVGGNLEAFVKVDPSIPWSFHIPKPFEPTPEMVEGEWVRVDSGRLLENGSFFARPKQIKLWPAYEMRYKTGQS
mmetsp:Transcript_36787/g.72205  ORF Transcript_36787/g.72205 Transcript_36787/m.72205 type:complete len:308 (+) Transcript_36787:56-979(+)